MDLKPIFPHLTDRRAAQVINSVVDLEAAVAAGMVPNKLFVDAKDILNRVVEEAAEAFLATGPHAQKHPQSDWWLQAYADDAFVRGTHTLPTVLKRAQNARSLTEYAAFIGNALLPLHTLLASAKPLVKKRGELPKAQTAKQIADEADQMTCQCCGRGIFAATGVIAHHGYQRPGGGWQTASCTGARELPFEVSRDALGRLIKDLKSWEARKVHALAQIEAEAMPIVLTIFDYSKPRTVHGRPTKDIEVTRDTFQSVRADNLSDFINNSRTTFDAVKAREIMHRQREIKDARDEIKAQQARFDGWKQTHRREGGGWVEV